MKALRSVIDRLIIFCLGLVMAVSVCDATWKLIASALFSIAVLCYCWIMSDRYAVIAVFLVSSALCIWQGDPFVGYLPLFAYELSYRLISRDEKGSLCNGDLIAGILFLVGLALVGWLCSEASFAVFVLAVLIAAYLGIRERVATETESRLIKETDNKHGMELLMKQHAIDAQEKQDYEVHLATLKERNRIAREIHDNVGHSLSRALLMVGAIGTINRDEALLEPIDTLKTTLSDAMDSIRRSVHDLHDESIDLEDSIRLLIKDFTFCQVKLDYDAGQTLGKEIKYCILSIIKEALANVVKHSNADRVDITVRANETRHQLLIEDNGSSSRNSDGTGIGLQNMRDRVNSLGGTIYFSNEKGFRIFATFKRQTIAK